MTLTNPTDQQLSEAVAVHVAGWTFYTPPSKFRWDDASGCPTTEEPQFATSADAVLPMLEKAGWSREDTGLVWVSVFNGRGEVGAGGGYDNSPLPSWPFPKCACIALLRAHGVQVVFT